MVLVPCVTTVPVPPPSYQRAVARQPTALHATALTLVTTLRLLELCRLAVSAWTAPQIANHAESQLLRPRQYTMAMKEEHDDPRAEA